MKLVLYCKNFEVMFIELFCSCLFCLFVFFVCFWIRDGCCWYWYFVCFLLKFEGVLGGDVIFVEIVEIYCRFGIVEFCVWLGYRLNFRGVIFWCWMWVIVFSVEILLDSFCIVDVKKIILYDCVGLLIRLLFNYFFNVFYLYLFVIFMWVLCFENLFLVCFKILWVFLILLIFR